MNPNPISQQLQLLLTGYGYNCYDKKNQARADDLLVRQKASSSLEEAAQALRALEAEYQRRYIPPATRENPYPPAEAMEKLREIGRLRERISDLAARIRGMTVPTQDRVWGRFRQELTLLNQLLGFDYGLVQQTEGLYQQVRSLTPGIWSEQSNVSGNFDFSLQQLDNLVRDRQRFLLAMN